MRNLIVESFFQFGINGSPLFKLLHKVQSRYEAIIEKGWISWKQFVEAEGLEVRGG
jgi:hypothetical protein